MSSLEYWKNEFKNITDTSEVFDNSNVVANVKCQKKRNVFPSAREIEFNYPKPYNKNPPNCTDKKADGSLAFKNQCAIRMSIALQKSGVDFNSYTDPKCSHGHARGARSLANWLWKKHLCAPKKHKGKEARNIQSLLKGKAGILYFHNLSGQINNDHIDLFYNNGTQANYSNLWTAEEYWFFELNKR